MSGTLAAALQTKKAAIYLDIGVSTLWDKLNPDSPQYDPTFPKPVHLGKHTRIFLIAELDIWLACKAAERHVENAT